MRIMFFKKNLFTVLNLNRYLCLKEERKKIMQNGII